VTADIELKRISNEVVEIQPLSVHGILWLQTHFEDEYWDQLADGDVCIDVHSATFLSQDANQSGLQIIFPAG